MSYFHAPYRKYRSKSSYYRSVFMLVSLGLLFFYLTCNYALYYASETQCEWPDLDYGLQNAVRAMLVADLHLLVARDVSFFDIFRDEWQVHQAFQLAVTWHKPDVVFILGDIFEEGAYQSKAEFNQSIKKFHNMYRVPEGTKCHVVPGNQDMGYHGRLVPNKVHHFEEALKAPPVAMVTIRNVHFVLINSMAMEGDGCWLCARATRELQNISDALRRANGCQFCKIYPKPNINYSNPILIQHFPLYRESDRECMGPDLAPKFERDRSFMERRDCLSKEATELLLETLRPRLALSAHTHHACRVQHARAPAGRRHRYELTEITLPPFSLRSEHGLVYFLLSATQASTRYRQCRLFNASAAALELMAALVAAALLLLLAFIYMPRLGRVNTYRTMKIKTRSGGN